MERRRARKPANRPRILIVEDDQDTRQMYAQGLAAVGFDVKTVADAGQAFMRVHDAHPDIILTDLSMPRIDGWNLLEHLKRDALTRDIPIVVVTGHAEPSVRERATREGVAAFLVKPCSITDLATALRHVLALTRSEQRAPSNISG